MARKKKGKSAKRAQATKGKFYEPEHLSKAPHSFIISKGGVGREVLELVKDMRKVMSPYTASNLKVTKKNRLKDFISVAGPLGVTHLLIFSQSSSSSSSFPLNLRVIKLPRGPTMHFKVKEFSYIRDIVSSLRRPAMFDKQFHHHPLLVLNGFSKAEKHHKLITTMFTNMFPSINVSQINLSNMQRCVLVNYDESSDSITFRHYNIRAIPRGIGRGVKRLTTKKQIPNLAKYENVEEYVLGGGGNASESEGEMDGADNEVTLPQTLTSKSNIKGNQAAIRLTEIGPRLTLTLYKILEGCGLEKRGESEPLYHRYVKLTPKQVKDKKKKSMKKKKVKAERKKQQELNVKRKEEEKEVHKQRSLAGMKKKTDNNDGTDDGDDDYDAANNDDVRNHNEDDDREWYRQEVGEEPDEDSFPSSKGFGRKRKTSDRGTINERKKIKNFNRGEKKTIGIKRKEMGRDNVSRGKKMGRDKDSMGKKMGRDKGAKGKKMGKDKDFMGKKMGRDKGAIGKKMGRKSKYTSYRGDNNEDKSEVIGRKGALKIRKNKGKLSSDGGKMGGRLGKRRSNVNTFSKNQSKNKKGNR